MFHPQFVKTPEGGELVILARADYDALIAAVLEAEEDAADVAAYDAAKAADPRLQKPLPDGVSTALLKGDSLLKAWRKHRGLTQAELAARAEINQGYLSELEARSKTASRATLSALEVALEIAPESLA